MNIPCFVPTSRTHFVGPSSESENKRREPPKYRHDRQDSKEEDSCSGIAPNTLEFVDLGSGIILFDFLRLGFELDGGIGTAATGYVKVEDVIQHEAKHKYREIQGREVMMQTNGRSLVSKRTRLNGKRLEITTY